MLDNAPLVSVILPVYNSANYLAMAIESVLVQTYTHFELIVINDGSTDESENIINSFKDARIKQVKNERNIGLIATLNRGIEIANGEYIARMDADDICLPNRLMLQVNYLEKNTSVAVVASFVEYINAFNKAIGHWEIDRLSNNEKAILKTLPKENCLAHPTIMFRAAVAKQYKYHYKQKHTEDYDLWLRIAADGALIGKINEVLLQYRVHENSITKSQLQKTNAPLKNFLCKKNFLLASVQQKKWNTFHSKVAYYAAIDGVTALWKQLKASV